MSGFVFQLNTSGSTTIDASGNGQVSIGPEGGNAAGTWLVTQITVETNRPAQAQPPAFRLYQDTVSVDTGLGQGEDGSYSEGVTTSGGVQLTGSGRIICAWSGGRAGDKATLTVTGTKW